LTISCAPSLPTLIVGNVTNPTTCGGTGSIAFTTTNVPNGTYSLSFTTTGTSSPKDVTVTNNAFTLSPLAVGNYSNFSLNVSGASVAASTSKTVANPASPTLTAGTVTNTTTCGGTNGKIAFTSTNLPNGDYSVSFTPSAGATASPQTVTVSSGAFTLIGLKAGTYSAFSVQNKTTLCTGSLATPLTVAAPATPTIVAGTAVNPATCGATGSIPFTTTNLVNGTYELTFSPTGTDATTSPQNVTVSSNAFTLSGLAVGTYSNFSLIRTGCTATDEASKSIVNPVTPTLVAGTRVNPTFCGGGNGSIPFTTNLPNGTYQVKYTGAGSPKNVTVSSGTFTLSGLSAGGYSNFSVTNNGCVGTSTAARSLSDPNPPVLTLGTTKNPTACNLSDGSIAFTATNFDFTGSYALTYSVNGVLTSKNVIVIGSSGAFTLTGLADGVYGNFSIQNTSACTGSLETTMTLTDLALPVLTLGTPTNPTTCSGTGGSISFTTANLPDGTYSLNFMASAGATTSPKDVLVSGNAFTLNGLKAGDYSNFYIERLGCRGSVATLVSLTAPATPSVTAGLASNPTNWWAFLRERDFG
jgi:hypothetical protein